MERSPVPVFKKLYIVIVVSNDKIIQHYKILHYVTYNHNSLVYQNNESCALL